MVLGNLRDQVVLVTGGTSGFGRATAKLFIEKGAKVIITGRDQERLNIAQDELGKVDCFLADVTDPLKWEELAEFVIQKYGKLDILVNNAGAGVSITGIVDQKYAEIDKIISTNLNSVI